MTKDVKTLGDSYCFVHRLHPTILLLKVNASELNLKFSEYLLVDGDWYKLENQLFADLCDMVSLPCLRLAHLSHVLI